MLAKSCHCNYSQYQAITAVIQNFDLHTTYSQAMRGWVCKDTSTDSGSARSGDRASRTGGGRPTAEFANTSVDADRYPRKREVVTRVILRPPSSGPSANSEETINVALVIVSSAPNN